MPNAEPLSHLPTQVSPQRYQHLQQQFSNGSVGHIPCLSSVEPLSDGTQPSTAEGETQCAARLAYDGWVYT